MNREKYKIARKYAKLAMVYFIRPIYKEGSWMAVIERNTRR